MKRRRKELKVRFEDKIFYSLCGCWYWTGSLTKQGYGRIIVDYVNKLAHRISYILYKGELESGALVLHSCDNPSCVNPDHLTSGTQLENMKHMKVKLRNKTKEKHYCAKLNEVSVRIIREAIEKGFSMRGIALYFKIQPSTIGAIKKNLTWKNI